jgi:Leucine-rich repeat (LRR) protein
MAEFKGEGESLIVLLDPEDLADGITYTDGKLRSASRDITGTSFSASIKGSDEKLTGKIILEYKPGVPVNDITFPDSNFRAWINEQPGWVVNGYLTDEAKRAQNMDVHDKNISDLTGIEYFTELTELNCSSNELATLDITKNLALEELSCSNNKLTVLDVSNNTALTTLNCSGNELTILIRKKLRKAE